MSIFFIGFPISFANQFNDEPLPVHILPDQRFLSISYLVKDWPFIG